MRMIGAEELKRITEGWRLLICLISLNPFTNPHIRFQNLHRFYPEAKVRGAITTIFKDNFGGAWSCRSDAKEKKDVLMLWFNDFKAKFKWLANDEANIKKSFNSRGSLALKNTLFKVRSGHDKGDWIGIDYLKQLQAKWKEEECQKKFYD